jgi:hypothetical protein
VIVGTYPSAARKAAGTPRPYAVALFRVLPVWAFGVFPLIVFVMLFVAAGVSKNGDYAFDFKQFWQGAHDVVHGRSPYPSRELLETSSNQLAPVGIQHVFRFPYPAASALLLAPFGALPFQVAAAIEITLLIVATIGAFWLVGVRDWRVFGLVSGTVVVNGAIRLGTLTPLLMLLVAVAWRWRDRRWVCAPALAVAIVSKVFLWPLIAWLVITRRYATAALTTALTAAVTIGGWAVIGFDGFSLYPELVRRLTRVVGERGYSLVALGVHAGLPYAESQLLPYIVGLPLLVAGLLVVRRRSDCDRAAFAFALFASLLLTPIVWLHYFSLLLVPLALARPRFGWVWALPLLFWFAPTQENNGHTSRIVIGLLVAVVITLASGLAGWPGKVRARVDGRRI